MFRILPWREKILRGMLGADLIGFHTYDYERHFLSSVRRLMGADTSYNDIKLPNRIVRAENFPMGIDYDHFHRAATGLGEGNTKEEADFRSNIKKMRGRDAHLKLVLSIDRLDYTKGIARRLESFKLFLEKYPEYRGRVSLNMISVPSRTSIMQYKRMKSEVEELVGMINGKYSTISWIPIYYFFRSLAFETLVDLYHGCDIAMITPVRDGMNLVAKEFVACRTDSSGVLILSEMAGAAAEMSEALIVNPNNLDEIADRLKQAIEMPKSEQARRMEKLQERLRRYDIQTWSRNFLDSLDSIKGLQQDYNSRKLRSSLKKELIQSYEKAQKRMIFLDYDGTLVGFEKDPKMAWPGQNLLQLLDDLHGSAANEVVLISGRNKDNLEEWFGERDYTFIAEHVAWIKKDRRQWVLLAPASDQWKKHIYPILNHYVDRTPGSFVEEKNFSLVWHYRNSDPELGSRRANQLRDELTSFVINHQLEIMEGNKIIEIKTAGVNKGVAASRLLDGDEDFILAIGDDYTDEYLFDSLADKAFTIKVGAGNTKADYKIKSYRSVRKLLRELTNSSSA